MSLFGFNLFDENASIFTCTYKSFSQGFSSLTESKQKEVARGGKILMHSSALEKLTGLRVDYPMLFKLHNEKENRSTHCGVLEFTADDGVTILPYWIMQNLFLKEGEDVKVEYCKLPTATYAKFQPQNAAFLEISDPKAVLENAFRTFACLTKGDIITIYYNDQAFELTVKELKPADAVCIIECDLHFEFEEPVGYSSSFLATPVNSKVQKSVEEFLKKKASFSAFSGAGKRLDGKRGQKRKNKNSESELVTADYERGLPNYDWSVGELNFSREVIEKQQESENVKSFTAFAGQGLTLNKRK